MRAPCTEADVEKGEAIILSVSKPDEAPVLHKRVPAGAIVALLFCLVFAGVLTGWWARGHAEGTNE